MIQKLTEKVEQNFLDVCRKDNEETNVVYANLANSQDEHLKFCNNIGSSVATAKNEEELKNMIDLVSKTDSRISTWVQNDKTVLKGWPQAPCMAN